MDPIGIGHVYENRTITCRTHRMYIKLLKTNKLQWVLVVKCYQQVYPPD